MFVLGHTRVNDDFIDLFQNKVQLQFPHLKVLHDGSRNLLMPKAHLHPVLKLRNFAERHNVPFTHLFYFADPQRRMLITRDQFFEGIRLSSYIVIVIRKGLYSCLTENPLYSGSIPAATYRSHWWCQEEHPAKIRHCFAAKIARRQFVRAFEIEMGCITRQWVFFVDNP